MEVRITQLLSGLEDSSVPIEESGVVSAMRIKELTMNKIKQQEMKPRRSAGKRILSLALVAALILALGAVAYAISIRIIFKEEPIVVNGEEYTSISFEATDSEPVYLGVWELTAVPDGFSIVKNDYRGDEARTDYQNASGDIIGLTCQKAGLLDAYFDKPILSQEEVAINGNQGKLYVVDNGWSYLYWTVAERGIGFQLSVKGGGYDLLRLAESVRETDNYPPIDSDARQALAELGDWEPALPDGYSELVTYGVPGNYAYVRRSYSNAAHYEIRLDYEKAVSDLEGYVAYYRDPDVGYGVISYAAVTINGCAGWLMENEDGTPFRVTRLDESRGLVFQMSTNGVDSATLLAAAQGVTCMN